MKWNYLAIFFVLGSVNIPFVYYNLFISSLSPWIAVPCGLFSLFALLFCWGLALKVFLED